MYIMGFGDSNLCPYCQSEVEYSNHIFHCEQTDMEDTFMEETSSQVEYLETGDT